jgi:hypothetical protein
VPPYAGRGRHANLRYEWRAIPHTATRRGLVLVVAGTFVRRSDMASLIRRRWNLTPETQNFEEDQSDPVRRFAQLRRTPFGTEMTLLALFPPGRSGALRAG